MVRKAVEELLKLGPPPSEQEVIGAKLISLVEEYERLISEIEEPVTDEEAKALVGLFGQDNFFGMNWTLVHLIETAPNWPGAEDLEPVENEWVKMLRDRAHDGEMLDTHLGPFTSKRVCQIRERNNRRRGLHTTAKLPVTGALP